MSANVMSQDPARRNACRAAGCRVVEPGQTVAGRPGAVSSGTGPGWVCGSAA